MHACCGGIQVQGDVFLARVFDNEDEFQRLDFTLREVSSGAPWVKVGNAASFHLFLSCLLRLLISTAFCTCQSLCLCKEIACQIIEQNKANVESFHVWCLMKHLE
jgi:hypothetical protein